MKHPNIPHVQQFTAAVLFGVLVFFSAATAQEPNRPSHEPVAQAATVSGDEKIKQLKEQIEAMQHQLDQLRKLLESVSSVGVENQKIETEAVPQKVKDTIAKISPDSTSTPQAQEKREIGVDLGGARLTPYGSIYFNAFSNSGGTNNADVPLFATPSGRGGTGASLRQTRLGFRLNRFNIAGANAAAVIEADFFGGFPSIGIGENFGVVRLRLANVKMSWERTNVTVGQDWSVFAPSSPTSLAAAAIPQMAAAGNMWARLPQVKLEHNLTEDIALQIAVAAQQTGDSATSAPFLLQPNSGSAARLPFFQGRLEYSRSSMLGSGSPGFIALSGHYGRSRVFAGASNTRSEIDSVGVAADWKLPFHRRFWLTGEAFFGRNLAGFQGGIFQGYNTEFAYMQEGSLVPAGVRAIGTRGGWVQIGFTPPGAKERLAFYGSFGIDDPHNDDLVTSVPRDFRSRNLAFAFDTIYKLSPQFSLGAEYRRFNTTWTNSGRQNSNHLNLAAVYNF